MRRHLLSAGIVVVVALLLGSCDRIMDMVTPDPGAPGSLTASQGDYPDRIVLSWSAASDAETYRVYAATSATGEPTALSGEITETSAVITGMTPDIHYFYRVRGVNSADELGPYSSSAEGWAASYMWQDVDGDRQFYTGDPEIYGSFFSQYTSTTLSEGSTMTVDVAKVSGAAGQDYGVLFYYYDVNNFYYLGINTLGQWCLWEKYGGTWSVVQAWTASGSLYAGYSTWNEIKVHYWWNSSQGRYEHELYLNGTYVYYLWSYSPMAGAMGFGVQVGSSSVESFPGTPVDVRFSMTTPISVPDLVGSLTSKDVTKKQAVSPLEPTSSSSADGYPARGR